MPIRWSSNEQSRLGTPGLVDAIRRGQLAMVNALGSGILETRALLAFLPRICAGAAGRAAEAAEHRDLVVRAGSRARRTCAPMRDRMMIGPALSTRMLFDSEDSTLLGSTLAEQSTAASSTTCWKREARCWSARKR